MRVKLSAFLLIALLGLLLVSHFKKSQLHRVRMVLPDGSSLALEGMTLGTNHFHAYTTNLTQRLWSMMPSRFRTRYLKFPYVSRTSEEPTLVLWFKRSNTMSSLNLEFTIKDGSQFENKAEASFLALYLSPVEGVHAAQFYAFPRHCEELSVTCYTRNTSFELKKLGEFKVPNPAFKKAKPSDWTPSPMPVRDADGNLEITLHSMHAISVENSGLGYRPGAYAEALYSVQANGFPTDDWRIRDGKISDSSGNRQRVSVTSSSLAATNQTKVVFYPVLWPDDPLWKLELRMERIRNFPPESALLVTNVNLPFDGAVTRLEVKGRLHGYTVRLLGIASIGSRMNTNEAMVLQNTLRVRVDPPLENHGISLDCQDQAGRKLNSGNFNWSRGEYYYALDFQPDSKTASIQIGLEPLNRVEMIVRPQFVTNLPEKVSTSFK